MTAPAVAGTASAVGGRTAAPVRERWRMSPEALALVVVTASLQVFGLGVLYSASALQAVAAGSPGHHFVLRQALGVLVGIVCFMVAAKVDAERWRPLAWPLMGLSFLLMLVIILPGTESISGRVYGSRRYLFGGSIQPSEFAKFAILVWTPMLLVKKGTGLHRFSNGMLPFGVVIGALCVLAVLEPDLSVAAMFCLLMAVLLFVGGARLRHFLLFALLGLKSRPNPRRQALRRARDADADDVRVSLEPHAFDAAAARGTDDDQGRHREDRGDGCHTGETGIVGRAADRITQDGSRTHPTAEFR